MYKPTIKIIYIEVGYDKLRLQNQKRLSPIPDAAVEKMIDKLEVPKAWEAMQVEYVVQ